MRLPFLVLTPVSVLLGVALALQSITDISLVDLTLVVLGALLAHIGVNTLNEYQDFISGLDAKTTRTPFSGGSGALIDKPDAAPAVLYTAILSVALTILIGIYFIAQVGLMILPLGFLGVLLILTYTQWLNRNPFLCLIAPGLAFGPLMVLGTELVLVGEISMSAFWVSLVPFCLANNLLLLNQFPDVEADREVGRRHFPITYGKSNSVFLYAAFLMFAFIIVLVSAFSNLLPAISLLTMIPLLMGVVVCLGVLKNSDNQLLLRYMGMNVVVSIVTPLVLVFSIMLGSRG